MNKQDRTAHWQSLSDEWQASGEPQKKFCQRKGISYSQFVVWRSRILAAEGKARTQLQTVKIKHSTISPNHASSVRSVEPGVLLILPNGIKISVSSNTQITTIKTVFAALGVTPC